MREYTVAVEGMTCSACSAAVERNLKKTAGVDLVSVNLTTNRAVVHYDETLLDEDKIKEVITSAGYTPVDLSVKKEKNIPSNNRRVRVFTAIAFAVLLLIVSMGQMVGMPLPSFVSPDVNPLNFALLQLLLTAPILFIGRKFYTVGFKTLFKGNPNMDSLVAVSTTAALVSSFYAIYQISLGNAHFAHRLYFETAGVIVALILFGKFLEENSKEKASEALKKLADLRPKTALVKKGNQLIETPVSAINLGDIIIVKAGQTIAVDGKIVKGMASIDESMITGESIPNDKGVDEEVFGGAINKAGLIEVEVTSVGENTLLARIIKMVEDAQGQKAPIARIADIVSGYFVPTVMGIATISALAWYFYNHDSEFALNIFVAVLVIACPCALGLATPTAIMVATGKAAEHGILLKSGAALERAKDITSVCLDKTGTITYGSPSVVDLKLYNAFSEKVVLDYLFSLESLSEHPLALAVNEYCQSKKAKQLAVEDFENIIGSGLRAKIEKQEVIIASSAFLESQKIAFNLSDFEKAAKSGETPIALAIDGKLAAIVLLQDEIKAESISAVKALHDKGIKVTMLTGDNQLTAEAIAAKAGIDRVVAGVNPEKKAEEINNQLAKGEVVAMVGDGINDAPALALASLGFAIGKGTDIAAESADIVLLKNDIYSLVDTIELSKATIKNIKQNLFWAFFYNILGIPVAAGILYPFSGVLLSPMIGAAAMSMSSVSVVTNALRLKNFKFIQVEHSLELQSKTVKTEEKKGKIMQKTLTVEGMMCAHCQKRVEDAVNTVAGASEAKVDLEAKTVSFNLEDNLSDEVVKQAITEAGYEVV